MKTKRWKLVKSNLWRNTESGQYFARASVNGVDTWRSLETDLRTLADAKLPKKLASMRAVGGTAAGGGNLTLGECAAIYLERKRLHGHKKRGPLKPRSLDYRTETVEQWRRVVPGFDDKRPALVTVADLNQWSDKARAKYSVTRYNGMVESLRGIFDIATETGACEANLAKDVRTAPVPLSAKLVPARSEFTEILRRLDSLHSRRYARLSVRGLAFTGLRPNEARHVKPADVDLENGTLIARETKNGKPRVIQLIPQAIELFEEEGIAKVLAAFKKSPRKALMTICEDLGLPNMTPYTMRHLHMTALIESGADIASVALIAGHQDRGVTLLRNYVHPRSEHVRKQIKKVTI